MKKPIIDYYTRKFGPGNTKFSIAVLRIKREIDRIFLPILIPILTKINNFLEDTFGWVRSRWILLFWNIKHPCIFYGYNHFELAKRYADKRFRKWKCSWDQLGRQQGIIPFSDTRLLVCSPMEMKIYQKKKLLSREKNYKKYFRSAYWKTEKRIKHQKQTT